MEEARPPSLVRVERRKGDIALILIDNPPVNALSDALRRDLMAALDRVIEEGSFRGGVIACEGRTFIVGADITQFGKPREILTATIAAKLDAMPVPFVAALHGTALGGGFEVAMGCHARVIARNGFVGLPEVKIGLVPSGGGTQRLTRLAGPVVALDLISTGRHVPAEEALRLGLVDAVADDIREAAAALAIKLAAAGAWPRIVDRKINPEAVGRFRELAEDLKARAGKALAPRRGVEAIEFALAHSFEEGVALEQRISAELHAGPQSRAMRYLFHAERAAAKTPESGATRAPIRHVVIIGQDRFANDLAGTIRRSGLKAELVPRFGASADAESRLQGADLVILNAAASDDLRGCQAHFGDPLAPRPIFAIGVHGGADSTTGGQPQGVALRFFLPLEERRLLQVETLGTSLGDLASCLAFGRKIGRATVACYGRGHGLGARMRKAGQTYLDLLLKDHLSAAAGAALAEDFGLRSSAAAPSTIVNERELKECSDRIVAVMVNEGAGALSEGVVSRASDIDVILVHGYGYPAWRGGPMYEADLMGTRQILAHLEQASADGMTVNPSPLLLQLAREGGKFGDSRKV